MITRNYYYDQLNRDDVVGDNRRLNDVIGDFFNPRRNPKYRLYTKHFIERHKSTLEMQKPIEVRNTITDKMEYDWTASVKEGGFHVHTLLTSIRDDVINKPNKRIRDAMGELYGNGTQPDQEEVKTDLLNYAIRKRCLFIGNSKNSLYIQKSYKYLEYDGYIGWKGLVAYVTKTMYNVDTIDAVYDNKNSTILKHIG